MKITFKLLSFISKVYQTCSVVLLAIIAFILSSVIIYWISLKFGIGFAEFIANSKEGAGLEVRTAFINLIQVTLPLSAVLFIHFFGNYKVLSKLATFTSLKVNNQPINLQQKALQHIPQIICFLYISNLSMIYIFKSNILEFSQNTTWEYSYYFLLPDFGNALGLIFAFFINFYRKSLIEQEEMSAEVLNLKEEVDLVI